MKSFKILFGIAIVAMGMGFSACQQEEVLPEPTAPEQTTKLGEHSNGVLAGTIFLSDIPAGYESCFKDLPYLGYCTSHITEKKYYIQNDKTGDALGIMGWSDDQYAFVMRESKPSYPSGEYLIPYSISCNISDVVMPVESVGPGSDSGLGGFYSGYFGMYTLPQSSQATQVVFTIHYKVRK